ncbi:MULTISPECIES: efflux RND transporter periplasmic adaptor subunit [Shewanella]|uniref:efflux RND transporter periplasmic adaptor subunit n=1 Tax=Shewanella TaxID=22 RepID=UPI001BBA77E5|nr:MULTISPECIES: efflux RND transporter periplasmic adaptor subunit [Shewanella]GIU53918.1 hemolysin D [Shewanella sp. KT0246]
MKAMTSKLSTLSCCLLALTACSEQPQVAIKVMQPISVIQLDKHMDQHSLRFSGVVEAQEKADLSFRVSGTLNELLFEQGDSVKKGQVIARLDPHDYQVRANELTARLAEAEASLQLAKDELKRTQMASDDNAISDIRLQRAKTGVVRAQAGVDVVTLNLQQAKDALRYTELKAPFDGVIGRKQFDNYEQVIPGVAFTTIHQPNSLNAIVDIPEAQLNVFYKDQVALIGSNNEPQQLNGQVTEITTVPDPIKRTFSATIAISDTSENLYPGKVVNVRINDETLDPNSICLPSTALISKEQSMYIATLVDQKVHRVPVEVTKAGRKQTCIIAKEGNKLTGLETVIVAGAAYLSDGQLATNLVELGE